MKNKESKERTNLLSKYYPDYERLLEAIIDNLPMPISVIGKDKRFALVNKQYEEQFGKPRDVMLGKNYYENVKKGEISVHQPVLESGKPYRKAKVMGNPERTVTVDGVPIILDNEVVCSVGIIHEFHHIERIMSELEKRRDVERISDSEGTRFSFDDILGSSDQIKRAKISAKQAAETNVTVLLRGETGTGKEMFAHAIHKASLRNNKPFLRVNCAAISESLLESILFGYEPGAFTGAKKTGEIGLFESADKGTVFLDEIGELSPALQSKLLRVLQEGEIVRVGGTKTRIVDVRIIAATNANLEEKMEEKQFRRDLYYRLNVFPITIAPLRERKEDVETMAKYYLRDMSSKYGRSAVNIDPYVLTMFQEYSWPGNARELKHVIERAVIGMDTNVRTLTVNDLDFFTSTNKFATIRQQDAFERNMINADYQTMFASWESSMLRTVYEEKNKNKTAVAEKLGISVRSVYDKLKKYSIE